MNQSYFLKIMKIVVVIICWLIFFAVCASQFWQGRNDGLENKQRHIFRRQHQEYEMSSSYRNWPS